MNKFGDFDSNMVMAAREAFREGLRSYYEAKIDPSADIETIAEDAVRAGHAFAMAIHNKQLEMSEDDVEA